MHAFKRLAATAAITAMAGLSGCQVYGPETDVPRDGIPPGHSDTGTNEDGRWCSVARSGAVYILIGYDASGMPVVSPTGCYVAPGTKITWRGPDNDLRKFEIDFKAASASVRGQDSIASDAGRDRTRVIIVAGQAAGRYAYSVKANGKELDPEIIIDPR